MHATEIIIETVLIAIVGGISVLAGSLLGRLIVCGLSKILKLER